jgi:hypothetical protein
LKPDAFKIWVNCIQLVQPHLVTFTVTVCPYDVVGVEVGVGVSVGV